MIDYWRFREYFNLNYLEITPIRLVENPAFECTATQQRLRRLLPTARAWVGKPLAYERALRLNNSYSSLADSDRVSFLHRAQVNPTQFPSSRARAGKPLAYQRASRLNYSHFVLK